MSNEKLIAETRDLWITATNHQDDMEDLDPEVVVGAHYAALASNGVVKLNESGIAKVKTAHEALTELSANFTDEDADDEDEE
jgi:predicted metal-dependent HD superfamily phosphohydrolase